MSEESMRIAALEEKYDKLDLAISSIDKSLQSLVRLEERHAHTRESLERAFVAIKNVETKVEILEVKAPTWERAASVVHMTMIGICSVVGLAILGLVIVRVA